MKETAIQWLQEQLNKTLIDNQIQQTKHLFEQAKQMEKHQLSVAFESGLYDGGENLSSYNMDAEQYYNEYFKTE